MHVNDQESLYCSLLKHKLIKSYVKDNDNMYVTLIDIDHIVALDTSHAVISSFLLYSELRKLLDHEDFILLKYRAAFADDTKMTRCCVNLEDSPIELTTIQARQIMFTIKKQLPEIWHINGYVIKFTSNEQLVLSKMMGIF